MSKDLFSRLFSSPKLKERGFEWKSRLMQTRHTENKDDPVDISFLEELHLPSSNPQSKTRNDHWRGRKRKREERERRVSSCCQTTRFLNSLGNPTQYPATRHPKPAFPRAQV